jgi:pimeloyl-ACP methyl ester carboxylesterase
MSFELQHTTIHGHRVAYRLAGNGPPIILIHGITGSSRFAATIEGWIASTEPAQPDDARLRAAIRRNAA